MTTDHRRGPNPYAAPRGVEAPAIAPAERQGLLGNRAEGLGAWFVVLAVLSIGCVALRWTIPTGGYPGEEFAVLALSAAAIMLALAIGAVGMWMALSRNAKPAGWGLIFGYGGFGVQLLLLYELPLALIAVGLLWGVALLRAHLLLYRIHRDSHAV